MRLSRFPSYIYEHFDPNTGEVVYVGCGSGVRAWTVAGQRSLEHTTWFEGMLNRGHTPDEFVRIVFKRLRKDAAYAQERKMIKTKRPRFNRTASTASCFGAGRAPLRSCC